MRAGALIVAVGLAAGGCMTGRSEFAQPVAQSRPASQPMVLSGAELGDQVGSIAAVEPAVAVEPDSQPEAEPLALSEPQPLPAAAAAPGKTSPAQPKSKLLSPEEKAHLIAELEALAKSQDARAAAGEPTECKDGGGTALDPETRLNGDFGTGEC